MLNLDSDRVSLIFGKVCMLISYVTEVVCLMHRILFWNRIHFFCFLMFLSFHLYHQKGSILSLDRLLSLLLCICKQLRFPFNYSISLCLNTIIMIGIMIFGFMIVNWQKIFLQKKRLLLKVKNRFIYNITLFTYVRLSTMSHIHRRMRIRFRSRCLLRHHSCKPRCFRLLLLCH